MFNFRDVAEKLRRECKITGNVNGALASTAGGQPPGTNRKRRAFDDAPLRQFQFVTRFLRSPSGLTARPDRRDCPSRCSGNLVSFGPQVVGTVRSSTSAGNSSPTTTLFCTCTGATFSFTMYCLMVVRCSGSITTVSAERTPTVCAKTWLTPRTAIALATMTARFIMELSLPGGMPACERGPGCRVPVFRVPGQKLTKGVQRAASALFYKELPRTASNLRRASTIEARLRRAQRLSPFTGSNSERPSLVNS
jgi:hypothetical protein